jgi:hypothetical protein
MKTIYLVRHGIVEKHPNDDLLDAQGILFSENLPTLLKEEKIDFIAYVNRKNRCFNTIKHLVKMNTTVNPYAKSDFKMQLPLPLIEALKYDTSIICYGKSEKNMLFKLFDICEANDDLLYENIYKIQFQKISDLKITILKTGQYKNK